MTTLETFRLVVPDICYAPEIAAYRAEFEQAGDLPNLFGCGHLRDYEDPCAWLRETTRLDGLDEVTAEGEMPTTQFLYVRETSREGERGEADDVRDVRVVGMIQIRRKLNDWYTTFGGNIGYSVRPSERRRGYAKRMLADCLVRCAEMGYERVLVTCREINEASRRTIVGCGGVFESKVYRPELDLNMDRFWMELR